MRARKVRDRGKNKGVLRYENHYFITRMCFGARHRKLKLMFNLVCSNFISCCLLLMLLPEQATDHGVIQRVGGESEIFSCGKPTRLLSNTMEALAETLP